MLYGKFVSAQLYVNEIMALNTSTIQDNTGQFNDWIEIYNAGTSPVDLSNYYITDLITNPIKFRFTPLAGQVIVPASGHLIIWASGNTNAGLNHINFSLSSTNGEAVYLVAPDGNTIISSLVFPLQRENVSFGRESDGSNTIKYFSPSSPNASNNSVNAYSGFLSPPNFSQSGGFFGSNFDLTISHQESEVSIYYTSDGSIPNISNIGGTSYFYKNSYPKEPGDPFGPLLSRSFITLPYSSPITISDKTNTPNQISQISSTWDLIPNYIPNYNIKKGTVIRAIATKPGYLPSDIATNTYIYSTNGNNSYSLPVVSVTAQEDHLFGYNQGIYTAGATFDNYRIENPTIPSDFCTPGNFTNNGSAWEQPANIELVENQVNVLNQPLRIRIQGSCSASVPYKALRFYGTNKFDEYPFFPYAPKLFHDRIILRNSGNDYSQTMFKDVFVQKWMDHLRFSSQKSRPAIMFLNGEYWGIHTIRERIDNLYLKALYNVDENNLDLRKIIWDGPAELEEGDDVHYNNMFAFISNNDMSVPTNYAQVKEMLEPESFIDYEIAEIFIGNIDWPQNNVRLWRTRTIYTPDAPFGKDGRWRWILFDTDRALGEVVNAANEDLSYQTNKPENLMFKKLLDNPAFRNQFINRYADLLNSSFKTSHSTLIFNNLKNQYAPEITSHIARWKNLTSLEEWNTNCNIINTYLSQRPNEMITQLKSFFSISGQYNLMVATPDTNQGYVIVNTLAIRNNTPGLPINTQSWTGAYFNNIPLNITAHPKTGYRFSYWMYNGSQILDSTLTIITSENHTYTAYFEPTILSGNPIPEIAAELIKCGYAFTNWESNRPAGTSPNNSKFVYLNMEDPTIVAKIEGFTSGLYNYTSRTRINGLDSLGFSFINTSPNINPGYPNAKLGGFLLAINTSNLDTVKLSWTGRTITANSRKYRIRLYYREGDIQEFKEFSPTIEYEGSTTNGHKQIFSNIILPNEIMNKPYVQLFWKYYFTGALISGSRDQLAIDDIFLKGTNQYSGIISTNIDTSYTPNQIINNGKIQAGKNIQNYASDGITLLPGFKADQGSIFKAEIKTCH